MREIWLGKGTANLEDGEVITCGYTILVQEIKGEISCESYGIRITVEETGESAEILDLTVNSDRIFELGEQLTRNVVTPCSLEYVIADWL